MSNLKFSENLFLEVAEFNRFQKFMSDDGYKRHFLLNTDNFGLIRQASLPEIGDISVATNFYVSKSGTPFNQVSIGKGVAVDLNGNLLINKDIYQLLIPTNSIWNWIKIKYVESSIEKGTVSVDSLGNVTGVGTEFTKLLRGEPNFPSKLKFSNSVNGNADEYEVVKVISDTSLILQGDFTAESLLKYIVIGTFTPGFTVNNTNKNIYRYDNVEISLIPELVDGVAPAYVQNLEFFIARVKSDGVGLFLQDKRVQWFQTEAMNSLVTLNREIGNPLIGVESVKWDIKTSTRAENWIELAWGFRFSSWTIDTSAKRVSILIGNGGIFKDTSAFQNGQFNGWKLYSKNGKHQGVIDSIKSGNQIVLTLDVLNPEDYGANDQLFVSPPYEEIEIRVQQDGAILDTGDIDGDSNTTEPFPYPSITEIHNFSINTPLARFKVPAQSGTYKYNLTYRYKIFEEYSDWSIFKNDTVGHYTEKSFDDYGNLKPVVADRQQLPYTASLTAGFITVKENAYSFDIFQKVINTGDLYGVNTTAFTNAEPKINLIVSKSKKYQFFKGSGALFVMTADIYIDLKSFQDEGNTIPCREGNNFIIQIVQPINLQTFKLRIVSNYVNPSSYHLVKEINANDIAFIRNNTTGQFDGGMTLNCTFTDQGTWICEYVTDNQPKGTTRMLSQITTNAFDGAGNGQLVGYFGWKILTAANDLYTLLTSNVNQIGQTGGSDSITLSAANMPKHRHFIKRDVDDRATDGGGYGVLQIGPGDSSDGNSGDYAYTSYEGSDTPTGVTVTPKFYKFLIIEKIV